jgi:hypothetical protein
MSKNQATPQMHTYLHVITQFSSIHIEVFLTIVLRSDVSDSEHVLFHQRALNSYKCNSLGTEFQFILTLRSFSFLILDILDILKFRHFSLACTLLYLPAACFEFISFLLINNYMQNEKTIWTSKMSLKEKARLNVSLAKDLADHFGGRKADYLKKLNQKLRSQLKVHSSVCYQQNFAEAA